ncbi:MULTISPECIES: hypothetical protein [Streptomyces]|uniref:Uncharacterized protein n=1 Tax=Streptomyces ramulosus TaxID=47762 RepID=A0ABW1FTG3_9ACTN
MSPRSAVEAVLAGLRGHHITAIAQPQRPTASVQLSRPASAIAQRCPTPRNFTISSIPIALDLVDTADQIDRFRFRLRADPPDLRFPALTGVSAQVRTLVDITTAVQGKFDGYMHASRTDGHAPIVIQAYSTALASLGQALAELSVVQAEVALHDRASFSAYRKRPSDVDVERLRKDADEVVTHHRGEADEILECTSIEIRHGASKLAPPSARVVSAARTHPTHAPTLPDAAPNSAKSR